MTTKTDNLRGLFAICEGHVSVNINPHKSDYKSVKGYLPKLEEGNRGVIKAADKLEMLYRNKIVHIQFTPSLPGIVYDLYAGSVEMAAFRAFSLTKQIMGKEDFTFDESTVNLTNLLEELSELCRGEIDLNLNEFKSDQWGECKDHGKVRTLDDWFAFEKEINPDDYIPDEDGDVVYPEQLVNQVIRDGNMLEIHFYPSTPVGYYSFFNSDYGNVLETAITIAKREDVECLLSNKSTEGL